MARQRQTECSWADAVRAVRYWRGAQDRYDSVELVSDPDAWRALDAAAADHRTPLHESMAAWLAEYPTPAAYRRFKAAMRQRAFTQESTTKVALSRDVARRLRTVAKRKRITLNEAVNRMLVHSFGE